MSELPNSVYYVVGILVVFNLGTIGTLLAFIFKCGMFVAETKSGIKDAKNTGVRAHIRIDKLEEYNAHNGKV